MAVAVGKRVLDSGWIAARSTEVKVTGIQLTTTNPPSVGPKSPWMEAVVPRSVLATLVKNKVVPDPFLFRQAACLRSIGAKGRINGRQFVGAVMNFFEQEVGPFAW
ncbi:unnamed protein product [Linum trigynum]|uniref:Uncharacterized protein n=1 Tax=Linum trigynum TaxID=586398 RepID=A0AAV2E727_9ROSI